MYPAFLAILILHFFVADAYTTGNHLAGANGRSLGPGSDFQPWSQEYAKLMHFLAGAYYRSGQAKKSMEALKVGMSFYEKHDMEEEEEYEAMEDELDALLEKMGKKHADL
eukprot:g8527.t1